MGTWEYLSGEGELKNSYLIGVALVTNELPSKSELGEILVWSSG